MRSGPSDEQPGDPIPLRKAPDVMLRRVTGPLNALLACGIARYAEDGAIELLLNADEVAEGGHITISMRVSVRCSRCALLPIGPCVRCGAKRVVDELFSAWLAVRPGVADNTVLTPSALLRGMIHPVTFRVRHFRSVAAA